MAKVKEKKKAVNHEEVRTGKLFEQVSMLVMLPFFLVLFVFFWESMSYAKLFYYVFILQAMLFFIRTSYLFLLTKINDIPSNRVYPEYRSFYDKVKMVYAYRKKLMKNAHILDRFVEIVMMTVIAIVVFMYSNGVMYKALTPMLFGILFWSIHQVYSNNFIADNNES